MEVKIKGNKKINSYLILESITILVVILVIILPLINITYASEGGDDMAKELKLEIELEKEAYKVGESIHFKCRIENVAKKTIRLCPIKLDDILVYLDHENKKRKYPLSPKIMVSYAHSKKDIIILQPGESHEFGWLMFDNVYLMETVRKLVIGKYDLNTKYRSLSDDYYHIKIWTGELQSNTVRLDVINDDKEEDTKENANKTDSAQTHH